MPDKFMRRWTGTGERPVAPAGDQPVEEEPSVPEPTPAPEELSETDKEEEETDGEEGDDGLTAVQLEAVRSASEQVHLYRQAQVRSSRPVRRRCISWGPAALVLGEEEDGIPVEPHWKCMEQVGAAPPPVTPTGASATCQDGRVRNAIPDGLDVGEAALADRLLNGVQSLLNPAAPLPSPADDSVDLSDVLAEHQISEESLLRRLGTHSMMQSTAATTPATAADTPGVYERRASPPGPFIRDSNEVFDGTRSLDDLDIISEPEDLMMPDLSQIFSARVPSPRGLEEAPEPSDDGLADHDNVT